MSTKNPDDTISDKELEELFEKDIKKGKGQIKTPDQADKIVKRARRESSSKNVAEYAFVKFWTGVLEFAALFGMFIKQKSVNKNNETNDDESKRSK